ncbi:MAG TPA: hypothetical protein VOB72_26790 [Candidatus Dormibacteraeota bacterium]|nr:hypothetical protein [Candidatus Dormibacteraeota bacterium]
MDERAGDVAALGTGLADALEAGAELPPVLRRRLFAALVRVTAAGQRAGAGPPFADGAVAVEDVALTAAEMLRATAVTSFELAALFNV